MAAIVVEQHARKILPITDRALILDRGRIVFEFLRALLADGSPLEQHLGVTDSEPSSGRERHARSWHERADTRRNLRKFETFEKAFTGAPALSQHPDNGALQNKCADRRKRWSIGWARGAVAASWPE